MAKWGGHLITIDGDNLSIQDVVEVARNRSPVKASRKAMEKVEASRRAVVRIVKGGKLAYGIKTGLGEMANVSISDKDVRKLQKNLIRSHSVGVGDAFPDDVVRAALLLRANTLIKGYSGVRKELIEILLEMLNKGVHPIVPQKGSVGASGDLAPLAHIGLVMSGEGEAFYEGSRMKGSEALRRANITPIEFQSKEGVALINGTAVMSAVASLDVHDAALLLKDAQIAGSMSFEALKSSSQPFDERIAMVRPHPGQAICSRNLMRLLSKSEIIPSHKECQKVQDAYTIRCMPQVVGACYDAVGYVQGVVRVEINSATDNPIIFAKESESLSGGNFHGQPIAMAMDFLSLALCTLGGFSERRIARLIDSHLSGLPPFLVEGSGLNSGFMVAQYTAAALASENKGLAHPSSADSIPTSANQEDYVSMGLTSARRASEILKNVQYIIAIEYLCAAQALDFLKPLKPGIGPRTAYESIREVIPPLKEDRPLYGEIENIRSMVANGEIVKRVEKEVGELE